MHDQERKKINNAGGFRQGLEEIKERIDAMIDDGTDHPNPHEPAMRQALAEIEEWNPGCAKAIEDFIVAERRWFHEFANLLIDSDYFQCVLREIEPKERGARAIAVRHSRLDPVRDWLAEERKKHPHGSRRSFVRKRVDEVRRRASEVDFTMSVDDESVAETMTGWLRKRGQ